MHQPVMSGTVKSVVVDSMEVLVWNLQASIWVSRRWKTMKEENDFMLMMEMQRKDLFIREEIQRAVVDVLCDSYKSKRLRDVIETDGRNMSCTFNVRSGYSELLERFGREYLPMKRSVKPVFVDEYIHCRDDL